MRVSIVDVFSVDGGAERALAGVAPLLAADLDVEVVTAADGALVRRCHDAGVAVRIHPAGEPLEGSSDVLVAWGARSVTWARAWQATRRIWVRTLTPRRRPAELEAASHRVDVVTCPATRALGPQRALTPEAEVVHVPPGVDLASADAHRERPVAAARPVVGMVARIDPAKGQDRLLDAAALLVEGGLDLDVLVVGGALLGGEAEARHQAALRRRAGAPDLAGRVRLVGHVDDPWPWQARLDVATNLSSHEAFGLSTVEAMALGVPVVATATDGSVDLLDDSDAGILVGVDAAPDEIATAIASVLGARPTRDGPARAQAYSIDRFAARLSALCRGDRVGFEGVGAT